MEDRTHTPIRTVFCATDFSENAKLALDQASDLARHHGARLVIGHVIEPIPVAPYPLLVATNDGERAIREYATERIAELVESMKGPDLEVESMLATGAPGYELIGLAEQAKADVFVIGTRGLTGFEHLLFGSTAEHVVRCCKCPVLTIHPEDKRRTKPLETVVVPTDLSDGAAVAVDAFVDLFENGDRPKVLLAFADPTPAYLEASLHASLEAWHEPDLRKEEIEVRMGPLVEKLKARGFEVETVILDGGPVHGLTTLAKEREAGLIVMGTHGRSAVVNVLLGRTAQRIVQHAPCPVLTIRVPKSMLTEEGAG